MRSDVVRRWAVVRRLRQRLRFDPGPRRRPADLRRAAGGVIWQARVFYLFVVFLTWSDLSTAAVAQAGAPTAPLWPVVILNELLPAGEGLAGIAIAGSLIALLAAVFPGSRLWRLGVLLYLLVVVALRNSYGGITHGSHFLIYVGFAFSFLPPAAGAGRRSTSRGDVLDCVMVLGFAQSIVLLAYSLAGFWKLWASGTDLLAADGFVRILLHHLMDTTRPVPPLMPFLARHGRLAQLLFLGVVYVELCSLAVLFRPHLHRPWGIALMLAHFGAAWALGVAFPAQQFIVGLLLVCSPLAPARFSLLGMARSLPGLGLAFRYAGRRTGTPAIRRPGTPPASR